MSGVEFDEGQHPAHRSPRWAGAKDWPGCWDRVATHRTLRELATLRRNEPALRRGTQVIRHDAAAPGVFAFSRIDAATGRELLMVFNTATRALRERIAIDPRTTQLVSLYGQCNPVPVAPGSYSLAIGPLDFIICAATPAPTGESPP